MFSIDLLKGKGLPHRSSPKRALMKAVSFLIPIMAVMAWAASYQHDCRLTIEQKAAAEENQSVIEVASKAIKTFQQINSSTADMNRCLDALTAALSYRVQVSDLLVAFVQNLPDEIIIYEVDIDREAVMEKVKNTQKNVMEQHLAVDREMKLTLCGFDSESSDQLVQDYVDRLKQSEMLSTVFADIKPTAQQRGVVDGRSATYYEIECTLHRQD